MKKILLTFFFLFFTISIFTQETVLAQQEELSYIISIDYDSGKLSLNEIKVVRSEPRTYLVQPKEGYEMKINSFSKENLFSFKFNINPVPADINPTNFPDKTTIVYTLPYFENAEFIEVLDQNGKNVLSVDVSMFAPCKVNNICDSNENIKSCPEDCSQKQIQDNFQDINQKAVTDKNNLIITFIIGGILVVSLAVFLIFKVLKRKPLI